MKRLVFMALMFGFILVAEPARAEVPSELKHLNYKRMGFQFDPALGGGTQPDATTVSCFEMQYNEVLAALGESTHRYRDFLSELMHVNKIRFSFTRKTGPLMQKVGSTVVISFKHNPGSKDCKHSIITKAAFQKKVDAWAKATGVETITVVNSKVESDAGGKKYVSPPDTSYEPGKRRKMLEEQSTAY